MLSPIQDTLRSSLCLVVDLAVYCLFGGTTDDPNLYATFRMAISCLMLC